MKIYIIAGEPSGDLLAAGLMRAVRRIVSDVEFRGVGGEAMMAASMDSSCAVSEVGENADDLAGEGITGEKKGFKSLFDITEISVMGIFEVLPRLPLLLRRISQTVKNIETYKPDVLVTVDSWGFVSAVLSRLHKNRRKQQRSQTAKIKDGVGADDVKSIGVDNAAQFPVVHYVAPQVWAWKKGRAKNVARLVDRLMTLLPNEGRYFEKYGLQSDFVGHPVVERIAEAENGTLDPADFRAAHGIPADATVISVLPGSRRQEVKRLLPIMKEAVRHVAGGGLANPEGYVGAAVLKAKTTWRTERIRGFSEVGAVSGASGDLGSSRSGGSSGANALQPMQIVVPTVAGVEDQVREGLGDFEFPVTVVTGEVNRYNAFAVSDIAIAKSGTVSLELAALGVPHLIAYTFNKLSNLAAKLLVKVRFANLINIIADREIIPEFVLDNCRPEPIAKCALRLISLPQMAEKQVKEVGEVVQKLRLPDILPSDRAAQVVVEMARR